FFLFSCSRDHPDLPSFPTRRSSDLVKIQAPGSQGANVVAGDSQDFFERMKAQSCEHVATLSGGHGGDFVPEVGSPDSTVRPEGGDRKSTRLNSSHVSISYAVFCLKK